MGATHRRWLLLAREQSNSKDCDLPPPTGGARLDTKRQATLLKFDQARLIVLSIQQITKHKRACCSKNAAFATGDEPAHAITIL
jgi:hypothetical protein